MCVIVDIFLCWIVYYILMRETVDDHSYTNYKS